MENKKIQIRKKILEDSYKAGACHIGSALSCVDILVDLYYKILKKGDIFIFAKASGVSALYAILEDKGIVKNAWTWLKNYPLANKKVPGVVHSVGSVGMGLSVAAGLALADRKKNVYCLISDGQLQEGVTYEAALFANHHNLKNLIVICDYNGLQALGKTKDILGLATAVEFFKNTFPNFQCIRTVKGKGVPFLEDKVEGHYINLTKETYKEALNGLA